MAANRSDHADTIEREIDRTQDRIGDTVEKIEEKMDPSEITRSVLGDDGQETVRNGIRIARENPIPVALIAVGAVWLFATSDTPMIRRVGERLMGSGRSPAGKDRYGLRPRSEEPAPIGPPLERGEEFDRRRRGKRARA